MKNPAAWIVAWGLAVVFSSLVNLSVTAVLQWAIAGLFDKHVPFWPLFAALAVIGLLLGQGRQ